MNGLFHVLETLVSLTAPTVVLIQQLFCTTLVPVRENPYWRLHEAESSCAVAAALDFREPTAKASTTQPFLVLKLRESGVTLKDFRARYGEPAITDASVHHPSFVGYTFNVKGRPVGVNADTKTDAIISVSVDYSLAMAPDRAASPEDAPVNKSR